MSFEIGQRIRIIGPTKYGYEVHIGKCFVIGDKELHGEYSTPGAITHGRPHRWNWSSRNTSQMSHQQRICWLRSSGNAKK